MKVELSLLDALAYQVGVACLSDLHDMKGVEKVRMARALEKIPAGDAELSEWNDALCYITGQPEAETAEAARERLMEWLNSPEQKVAVSG